MENSVLAIAGLASLKFVVAEKTEQFQTSLVAFRDAFWLFILQ